MRQCSAAEAARPRRTSVAATRAGADAAERKTVERAPASLSAGADGGAFDGGRLTRRVRGAPSLRAEAGADASRGAGFDRAAPAAVIILSAPI